MKQFGWIFTVLFFFAGLVYAGTGEPIKNDVPAWNDISIRQSHISVNGSYRLRGEFQDEYDIKTYGTGDCEDFLLSRLRLNFMDLCG